VEWQKFKETLRQGNFLPNDLFPIIAATYVTRRWREEPVWILAVAPPGSGKTCTSGLFSMTPEVEIVSSVTPAGLISGWGGDKIDPSLFARINNHLLIAKDFGTLLSSSYDTVNFTFALLREAFDGHVKKVFGCNLVREYTNLHFNFVAVATDAAEAKQILRAQLGERFIRFNATPIRLPSPPPRVSVKLRSIVAVWLGELERKDAPKLSDETYAWVDHLSIAVAKLRTEVIHDGGSKEVLEIPEFEGSARLQKQLSKLYQGLLLVLSGDEAEVRRLVLHTAISAIAPRKLGIMRLLYEQPLKLTGVEIAEELRLGYGVVQRTLNDFFVLRLTERVQDGFPKQFRWKIADDFREQVQILLQAEGERPQ
jgi:hypothetical protein